MTSRERKLVGAAFATQAAAIGATLGSYSLFVTPIGDEFGASRLQMSLGVSFMTLMLGLTGIAVGTLLDRGSIRSVMLAGAAWVSSGLAAASQAGELWHLALLCLLVGAGIPTLGPLASSVLVSKAFDEGRGQALGIANMGVPVGSFVFALVAGQSLAAFGWRSTLLVFSALVAVVSVAAIFTGVPSRLVAQASPDAAAGDASSPAALLRTPDFIAAACGFGIATGTTAGWSAHLAAFLLELGASTQTAAAIVAGGIGGGLLGGLSFGSLADRHTPKSLLYTIIGVQALGFVVLSNEPTLWFAAAAAVAIGIVGGGLLPVFMSLLASRFGTDAIGRAAGVSNLFILPFGFGVPIAVGALRDATGDYRIAMIAVLGLITLSGLSFSRFRGDAG